MPVVSVKPSQTEYRLHHHDPRRKFVLTVLLVVLLLVLGGLLYYLGFVESGYQHRKNSQYIDDLEESVAYYEARNKELIERVAQLERFSSIEKQASESVRLSLQDLQTELLELNEEVSFYRSLVSPSEMKEGLHIREFQLTATEQPNLYDYQLTLTQVRGNGKRARGKIEVVLRGKKDGKNYVQTLAAEKKKNALRFSFKYFQPFTGQWTLPAGIQPETLQIAVSAKGKRLKDFEKEYSWSSILLGGEK